MSLAWNKRGGTAGRIENAQVGVFLAYASGHGHTLIDRRAHRPESSTADRQRCTQVIRAERGAGPEQPLDHVPNEIEVCH